MKKFALPILLTLILSSQPALAETSMGYALMGAKTWSAFECVALASFAKKYEAEEKRLFKLGYDSGTAFLQALREGKIKKEDLSSHAPLYFLLLARGPNNDFILGRAYEFVVSLVSDDLSEKAQSNFDSRKTYASIGFSEKNCRLIK